MELVIGIIAAILIILGFIGIFVPAIPDVPMAWAGLVLYAWGTGFEKLNTTLIIVFTILTIIISGFDILVQIVGAKKFDASKYGTIGIIIGIIVGLFWTPVGTIICPILGAFIGEFIYKRDYKQALKSAGGSLIGFLCGSIVKAIFIIVIAFVFIVGIV